MKILSILRTILIGLLLVNSCFPQNSMGETEQTTTRMRPTLRYEGSVSPESCLEHICIEIRGWIFPVVLSENLKQGLVKEEGLKDTKLTEQFLERFKAAKSSKIYHEMAGVYFDLRGESVYHQIF